VFEGSRRVYREHPLVIMDSTELNKITEKPETGAASAPPVVLKRLVFRRNGTNNTTLAASSTAVLASQDRRRLSPVADPRVLDDLLAPIHKHHPSDLWDDSWSLYWMPMSFRQGPPDPRIVELLELVITAAQGRETQHEYTFLEQSAIHPHLTQVLVVHAVQYLAVPIIGLRPEAGVPRFPSTEGVTKLDAKTMSEIALKKNTEARLQDFFPDTPIPLYWIRQSPQEARRELFGEGGWSLALSPYEEDAFFEAIKTVLFKGVEDEGLRAFPYVAPLLSSQSFIRATRSDLEAWFDLFPLYIAENVDDCGLTIASSHSMDDLLVEWVKGCGLRRGKNGKRNGRGR
jgi:hypothetical protein